MLPYEDIQNGSEIHRDGKYMNNLPGLKDS